MGWFKRTLIALIIASLTIPVVGPASLEAQAPPDSRFNVLKCVFFDKSGLLTLVGDRDPAYPLDLSYDALLATAFQYPQPAFTFELTPDSARDTDRFLSRVASDSARIRTDAAFRQQITNRLLDPAFAGGVAILKIFVKEIGVTESEWNEFRAFLTTSRPGDAPTGAALEATVKIFKGIGKPELGDFMRALSGYYRDKTPVYAMNIARALGPDMTRTLFGLRQRLDSGQITLAQFEVLWNAAMLDRLLELVNSPSDERLRLVSSVRSGAMPFAQGFSVWGNRVSGLINAVGWQKLLTKGFYWPPAVIESLYGAHIPTVAPVFIKVPGGSALGKILYDADFAFKNISELPETRDRVADHLTWEQWEIKNLPPEALARASGRGEQKMWLTPGKIDLQYSDDKTVLRFNGAGITINAQSKSGNTWVNDPDSQGYAAYLQGRYGLYEGAYPALHNVREALKVVAIANWFRKQGVTPAPATVPTVWTPPATIKGWLQLAMFQGQRSDTIALVANVVGGADLGTAFGKGEDILKGFQLHGLGSPGSAQKTESDVMRKMDEIMLPGRAAPAPPSPASLPPLPTPWPTGPSRVPRLYNVGALVDFRDDPKADAQLPNPFGNGKEPIGDSNVFRLGRLATLSDKAPLTDPGTSGTFVLDAKPTADVGQRLQGAQFTNLMTNGTGTMVGLGMIERGQMHVDQLYIMGGDAPLYLPQATRLLQMKDRDGKPLLRAVYAFVNPGDPMPCATPQDQISRWRTLTVALPTAGSGGAAPAAPQIQVFAGQGYSGQQFDPGHPLNAHRLADYAANLAYMRCRMNNGTNCVPPGTTATGAQPPAPPASSAAGPAGHITIGGQTIIDIVAAVGRVTAQDRAAIVQRRLDEIKREGSIAPGDVVVRVVDGSPSIFVKEALVLTVYGADAQAYNMNAKALAESWAAKLRDTLAAAPATAAPAPAGSPAKPAAALTNFTIIQGYGIGPIRVGMTRDDVDKLLGKPDKEECPFSDCVHNITYTYTALGLHILLQARPTPTLQVFSMSTNSNKFVTDKGGIKVGSPVSDVLRTYGRPILDVCSGAGTCLLKYDGILFITDGGKSNVLSIGI